MYSRLWMIYFSKCQTLALNICIERRKLMFLVLQTFSVINVHKIFSGNLLQPFNQFQVTFICFFCDQDDSAWVSQTEFKIKGHLEISASTSTLASTSVSIFFQSLFQNINIYVHYTSIFFPVLSYLIVTTNWNIVWKHRPS